MAAIQGFDSRDLSPFRHIVEQVPEAVIFADTAGLIRVWNRGSEGVPGTAVTAAQSAGSIVIVQPPLLPTTRT